MSIFDSYTVCVMWWKKNLTCVSLIFPAERDQFNKDPVSDADVRVAKGQTGPAGPSCHLTGPARRSQGEVTNNSYLFSHLSSQSNQVVFTVVRSQPGVRPAVSILNSSQKG